MPALREGERSVIARVLPTGESLRLARQAGLAPKETLALYGHGSKDLNESLFREFRARAVLSKSSGYEGGVPEKARAAASLGIPFILIARPEREGRKAHDVAAVLDAVARWKKEVQG
jgi:precorrin-6x reductase